MSTFAADASLLVAAFDLFAVSKVVSAIRAADLESGDVLTPSGIIEKPGAAPAPDAEPDPSPAVDRYDNGPRLAPAQLRLQQSNTYAPLHPKHVLPLRLEPMRRRWSVPVCDLAAEPVSAPTNPIQPPWKVLPWMDRTPRHVVLVREIKIVAGGSDMSLRGKVLDVVV